MRIRRDHSTADMLVLFAVILMAGFSMVGCSADSLTGPVSHLGSASLTLSASQINRTIPLAPVPSTLTGNDTIVTACPTNPLSDTTRYTTGDRNLPRVPVTFDSLGRIIPGKPVPCPRTSPLPKRPALPLRP